MFDIEGLKWILLKEKPIKQVAEDGFKTKTQIENWCIENKITGYAKDIVTSLNSVRRFNERVKNAAIIAVRIAEASTREDYFPSKEQEAARDGMGILLQEFIGSGGLMDCGDISKDHPASQKRILYFREIGWGKRAGRDGEIWNAALIQAFYRFSKFSGLKRLVIAPCQDFQQFKPADSRAPFGFVYGGERYEQVMDYAVKLSQVSPEEFNIWRIPLLPTLDQALEFNLVDMEGYKCRDVEVERLRCIRALAAWCLVKCLHLSNYNKENYQDVDNSYSRGGYFSVIGEASAWSDVLNHIRRQELLASGFTEEQVGLDGKLYGVNEVEHKNDWRRII